MGKKLDLVNDLGLTEEMRQTVVRRICDAWIAASETDVEEGRFWYHSARELAYIVGDGDLQLGAAIIAALSPMLGWERNMQLALAHVRGTYGGCLGSEKAVKIIEGILTAFDAFNTPTASKTRNFWHCIMRPGDPNPVCIDRHAYAIAMHEAGQPRNAEHYDWIADAYREAAAKLGELPSVVQAVTWVWWRREGAKQHGIAV